MTESDSKRSDLRRIRMPDTRGSATRKITIGGFDAYITVGFYENDQPGEVFVKIAKSGSVISGFVDLLALSTSMLLQVGVPASRVAEKLQGTRFEPADEIHTSVADAIGKALLRLVSERGGRADLDYELREVDWSGSRNPSRGRNPGYHFPGDSNSPVVQIVSTPDESREES